MVREPINVSRNRRVASGAQALLMRRVRSQFPAPQGKALSNSSGIGWIDRQAPAGQ